MSLIMVTDGLTENMRGYTTSLLIAICTSVGVSIALLHNSVPSVFIASELLTSLLLFIALRVGLHQLRGPSTGIRFSIVVPTVVTIPFIIETISRAGFSTGLPLEATTMCAIRNVTFLPFLFPHEPRSQSTGVAASLLAMLSIYLQDRSLATSLVIFSYSVLGICWLIGWHWMKFQLKTPTRSQRQIPRSAKLGVVGVTVICGLIALVSLQTPATTTAIAGFMPSSGGTDRSDPYAFGGIGDGDQMVEAIDSAKSLGPIESQLFLESTMPSIYDVFNDLYDEPVQRPKKSTRAIPLAPSEFTSNHERLAKNEVASREFTATRRRSDRKKRAALKDIKSKAMFYVKGRVPIHLKHEVYNVWDGSTLSFHGKTDGHPLTLASSEQNWMFCGALPSSVAGDNIEKHVIRIAGLSTRRVPSPANLFAVGLDKLHTANFFTWTQDGVLSLDGSRIPRMTVLHTRSTPPRREAVESAELTRGKRPVGTGLNPTVSRLLKTWTADAKTDWDLVGAIVGGIQETCQLDPMASIEATDHDVVDAFLLTERKGPDYLFAIATARLLREQGFRAHVVSGFYARPDNYDRESGQTAVYPKDVHFWVEVQAHDQSWLTVDPSPGYEVQYARLSLVEQFYQGSRASLAALWSHRLILLIATSSFIAAVIYHRYIYAYLLHVCWILPLPRTDRAFVRASLNVLHAYATLHGRERPLNITVEAWLRTAIVETGTSRTASATEFRALVQWALYANPEHRPTSSNPHQICRDFLSSVLPSWPPKSNPPETITP